MAETNSVAWSGTTALNILLRVPPLFVLDYVALVNFGSSPSSHFLSLKSDDLTPVTQATSPNTVSPDSNQDKIHYASGWPVLLHTYACALSFILLLLPSSRLTTVYRYLTSIVILYLWMPTYIDGVAQKSQIIELLHKLLTTNPTSLVDLQGDLARHTMYLLSIGLFAVCRTSKHKRGETAALFLLHLVTPSLSFLLPDYHSSVGILSLGTQLAKHILLLSPSTVGFALLLSDGFYDYREAIPSILEDLHWCRAVLRYHGLFALFESQWIRLRLPNVLQAFWITKAVLLFNVWLHSTVTNEQSKFVWTVIGKRLLLSNCETLISLLGSSAIVCFLCDSVGHLVMRWFLQAPDETDEKSVGPISAILFFVLALQTGLTEINGELRFVRLYQNLCLLLTANLHLLHNTLSQVLFWLSASRNNSLGRHIRALFACALLAITSIVLAIVLVRTHTFGSWLLAVIAFCVEMVIKVILTLIVYALFMLDAYRMSLWESLDDYVFYVRSLSSSVEFLFAILIFFNGAWILAYESGGRIRAFMVGVHLYFNIWLQAIAGIRVILKRRKAAKKLNLLWDASSAQLEVFDDVCAICYQQLASAKITACRHYFHAVCLRKWLNIRDTCPICQEVIFPPEIPPVGAHPASSPSADFSSATSGETSSDSSTPTSSANQNPSTD